MPLVLHDYITQRGGAERVALLLAQRFGGGSLTTSAFIAESTFPEYASVEVTELLRGVSTELKKSRASLAPLTAWSFNRHAEEADVILCSSSGWAHWTSSRSPSLVYCYTPPRWFWEPHDYFGAMPAWVGRSCSTALSALRTRDVRKALSRDRYIAISSVGRSRIQRAYGIDAEIVAPPVALEVDAPAEPVEGLEAGFYLTVSRPRSYKNTDAVIRAFEEHPGWGRLVVVGRHRITAPGTTSVVELGRVSDQQLRWLYASCSAVVAMSYEDFGLTPVEGHVFGKPTVALRAGGYLDTCREGVNAVFVDAVDDKHIGRAIREVGDAQWSAETIVRSASKYSVESFLEAVGTILDDVRGA